MSQGIAIQVREGKLHPHAVYIKLKGGAVYRYPKPLDDATKGKLIASVQKRMGKVQLKYWEKVR